jgi:hypothetical protein
MGLVEGDVGGLEVADGLGYILTDRPVISAFRMDEVWDSLGDGISINLLSYHV